MKHTITYILLIILTIGCSKVDFDRKVLENPNVTVSFGVNWKDEKPEDMRTNNFIVVMRRMINTLQFSQNINGKGEFLNSNEASNTEKGNVDLDIPENHLLIPKGDYRTLLVTSPIVNTSIEGMNSDAEENNSTFNSMTYVVNKTTLHKMSPIKENVAKWGTIIPDDSCIYQIQPIFVDNPGILSLYEKEREILFSPSSLSQDITINLNIDCLTGDNEENNDIKINGVLLTVTGAANKINISTKEVTFNCNDNVDKVEPTNSYLKILAEPKSVASKAKLYSCNIELLGILPNINKEGVNGPGVLDIYIDTNKGLQHASKNISNLLTNKKLLIYKPEQKKYFSNSTKAELNFDVQIKEGEGGKPEWTIIEHNFDIEM